MLYATAEKQLYQPRIVAVRTDLAPADAVISQLIYREGVEL